MIAFLTLCYAGVIWLVFFKLKVLKWNAKSQVIVVTVGVVAVFLLIVLMNLYQPQAVQAVVSQQVTPIVARVTGRVIEVPVERNSRVRKGDVLLRIEPDIFQAEVDRLQAALAAAEQAVPQLEAAWNEAIAARQQAVAEKDLAVIEFGRVSDAFEQQAATDQEMDQVTAKRAASEAAVRRAEAAEQRAKLAYESEIGGVNTTVAQTRAQLDQAKINLEWCTVYAPADGAVTQLFVAPGAVTTTMPGSSVMSFVYQERMMIRATFRPNAGHHMKVGDQAEVVFDTVPGQVFEAEVAQMVLATGAGALTPGGDLLTTSQFAAADLLLVAIQLDGDQLEQRPPVGTGCTVAVYTDGAKAIRIIRKVVLRIGAWKAYL